MDIKHIDDEATARKLLNCIAEAYGFDSAYLAYGHRGSVIKFIKKNDKCLNGGSYVVRTVVKSFEYPKALKELLNNLDRQGQVLMAEDNTIFDVPAFYLKKEDVFSNGILKFEAALMGVSMYDR